ncbi:major facilitator superfamily domain-containing protein [Lophiotrema nucula]|uniref:Major facilitator superfamily domain-containing protein n=1 Tax=Lophiotrema nucula TaxID=690887 RepID=A0A6A5Z1F7_9PLEO|nr:major facilitator superfamily domain-containing protein [Lophiotrema nucula]
MAGQHLDAAAFSQQGYTRTTSGRTTYIPDGLQSSLNPPVTSPHIAQHRRSSDQTAIEPAYREEDFDDKSDLEKDAELVRSNSGSTVATQENTTAPISRPISTHGAPLHPTLSHFSRLSRTVSSISRSRSLDPPNPALAGDIEKQQSRKGGFDDEDPNLVVWDGEDDPENPHNWTRGKKWRVTIVLGIMTFCITFASSVFSTATVVTAEQFGVSTEVMTLGTSLFVLGFAIGPPIWGPMSELFGRKYPLFLGFFIFAIFQIPVAVAQNLQTIMLCRFFGGVFGSAPLGIVGGTLTDFWGALDRGVAMTIFAGATFVGPVAGPIAGGFIVQSSLGWRWTEYLTAIMAFAFGLIGWIFVPETYGPILLSQRAKKIRFRTQNWAIHAKADEQQIDLKNIAEKYLLRPFAMLVREPILILVTLYMSLIYGILYLFFEAYPIAFQEQRGWNSGVGALPFLGITIGVLLGGAIIVFTTKTRFRRKLEKHGHVVPEERLIPMIIGGFLFPAGMFWFAWTSSPNITWVPQVLAGIPIGAGVLMIFLQGLNYIIDCYLMYANSAIAANTFVRSFVGAGFPLFATAMFHTLGVDWAASLLGFLTAALFPVPILFFFYGAKIRKMSRYSPT